MDKTLEEKLAEAEEKAALFDALQKEMMELKAELLKEKTEKVNAVNKSLSLYQRNEQLMASKNVSMKQAEMNYHLQMADQFIKSKAFPSSMNKEQVYTVMKAGQEMGLGEVESLMTLYVVNGAIKPYGDKMVAKVTDHGYRLEYLNETEKGVDVRCWHPDIDFDVTEKVSISDPILQKSNAIKFAPKNKMRFHGVRMIVSFHLAHLFKATSDLFTAEAAENNISLARSSGPAKDRDFKSNDKEKQRARILNHIESSTTLEVLNQVYKYVEDADLEAEFLSKAEEIKNKIINAESDVIEDAKIEEDDQ